MLQQFQFREDYLDGVLHKRWDPIDRKVYTFGPDGRTVIDSVDFTPEENVEADISADEAARLTSLEARMAAVEAQLLLLLPDKDPETDPIPDWVDPTGAQDAYPPNALVKFDGLVWQNISGTWLVHSPGIYPRGWAHVPTTNDPPPPTSTPAWAENVAYKVGDKVTFNGSTYTCAQAHTSQAGWTPVIVPALWTLG